MVTLQLEHPAPKEVKPADPVARPVMLWVGVSDSVLAGVRDNLPTRTRSALDSAEMGFPPRVRINGRSPMSLRRIRYNRVALGYGIIVSQWTTIAPKVIVPDHLSDNVAQAMTALRIMGLTPRKHLTDRPAT